MGLAGQAIGGAIADLVFGELCPSGRLAETWPMRLSDCPCQPNFGRNASIRQVIYREALNVGYRYFCTSDVPVRYPFGHGLSYASFKYADITLTRTTIGPTDSVRVRLKLTNTGSIAAAEVVQLYVRDCDCTVPRPDRELKAFAKVFLAPRKTEEVVLELTPRSFAFYDLASKASRRPEDGRPHSRRVAYSAEPPSRFSALPQAWRVEAGDFELLVGASCEDIRLTKRLTVVDKGAAKSTPSPSTPKAATALLDDAALGLRGLQVPPETPLIPMTALSTFEEIEQSGWFGRFLVSIMKKEAKKTAKGGTSLGEGEVAVAVCVDGLLGSSWCSLQLITGGGLPSGVITFIVHLLNYINRYLFGAFLVSVGIGYVFDAPYKVFATTASWLQSYSF